MGKAGFGLLCGLMACACSGSSDDDDFTCQQSDRIGRYLVQFQELSGDCGAIPDQLATIDDPSALPVGCTFDAADGWSSDQCTLQRAYTCPLPDVGPNTFVTIDGSTAQQDEDGNVISGTVESTIVDGTLVLCRSTYKATWSRE